MRYWALLMGLCLCACAATDNPREEKPKQGQGDWQPSKPTPKPTPKPTIVSLNPCTDAILAELAGPEQLLALSHYSRAEQSSSIDVAKARQFGVTGGTVEEVLALQPDIVIAGAFMPPATRAAFDDLGVETVTFGIASTVAQAQAQIRKLAQIAGAPGRGEALIAEIDRAMMRTQHSGPAASVVLWQPSGIVAGENTLVNELLRHTGFSSHSAAMGLGQADYLSLEQMLSDPPDVLLLAGQERAQHHPALGALIQTHQSVLDRGLLYCGGATIIRMVDRLAEIRGAIE